MPVAAPGAPPEARRLPRDGIAGVPWDPGVVWHRHKLTLGSLDANLKTPTRTHGRTRAYGAGVFAVVAAGAVIAAALLTGCDRTPTPPESPQPGPTASTNAVAKPAPDAAAADLAKVLGRWLRPDGGYILELKALDAATGRLDAVYLNPQPIHVAKAELKRDGEKVTVFVELQDVNYPGCTYRLTYFPATDQLYGVYYQAAMDQSFDVEFVRQR